MLSPAWTVGGGVAAVPPSAAASAPAAACPAPREGGEVAGELVDDAPGDVLHDAAAAELGRLAGDGQVGAHVDQVRGASATGDRGDLALGRATAAAVLA